jgi:RHS repeat-associated protein
MKRFYNYLIVCTLGIGFFISAHGVAVASERIPGKAPIREIPASTKEGLIGITEEIPIDNPVDNIFHVQLTEQLCPEDLVWLTYELDGVEDHTNISRSINDQLSVGGYLVKKHRGWTVQRERINPMWLKDGDNVIRFTIPENAPYHYRIRNLKIQLQRAESTDSERIVFNKPSARYYFDKAYIKGFFSGADYENVKIKIDGKVVNTLHGEFENLIEFSKAQGSCSVEVEAVLADGTTYCHTLSFTEPQNADYFFAPEYSTRAEKYFVFEQNEVLALNGVKFAASAGTLKENALISITSLRSFDIPALDGGLVNVTRDHAGFRFLPHGSVFAKEANITIPFDSTKIPDGYTPQDIRTYYFDEQSHHWVPLSLDTIAAGAIVSRTFHFTDMINGILKVPEAPEVEAYNSTSIKGIKAATPATGVNLIQPPGANSTGAALLNYPLNIPAGRNDVQPQLAVNYNNGGGNGWLGLGWSLAIPAVSIDTRWGVPRFDPAKETETYTLNGDQLSPVAHRGELQTRYADGKQFFPRIEGAFQKIIRRGSSPSTYWWEVTDKNGTRYFYGGSSATGAVDKAYVLRDNETEDAGNVAYWALSEIRDLNGNTVKFYYSKVEDTGLAYTADPNLRENGYQLYVDRITYTGFMGGDGEYNILFTRDREDTSAGPFVRRKDVTISANLGFKQVTADLLKKIDVKIGSEQIRSYKFHYKTGVFYKTLLDSISEHDADGKWFHSHQFDYYDDVNDGTMFKPLNQEQSWTMPGDGIHGDFLIRNFDGFKDESTALGGTKSTDLNVGVTISVGLGFNVLTKAASAGVSAGYSQSKSEGLLTMMDMNGDGLQDKIFSQGGTLYYRANLLAKTGRQEFSTQKSEITGSGIDGFYRDKSKTVSIGAEASFFAFVGYSHTRTTSKTSTYMADVNGDQLPDIVKKGKVYFNHLDPVTGTITFTETSAGTPSPIVSSGSITGDLLDVDALNAERERAIDENPLMDIVRFWKAPYAGTVSVTAPIQLLSSNSADREEEPVDGVRAAIQLRNTEIWNLIIEGNDYNVHQPTIGNLNVQRGDMIFFRLGSRDNGAFDSVRWEPIIDYVNPPVDWKDANGKRAYTFSSDEDFILSSKQTIAPPFDGMARMSGEFIKPQLTDTIQLMLVRMDDHENVIDTVWQHTYSGNEEAIGFADTLIAVHKSNLYSFKGISDTNVDWTAITWRPKLTYVVANDPSIVLAQTKLEVQAVPDYSMYVDIFSLSKPFEVKLDSVGQRDTINVFPRIAFAPRSLFDFPYTGDITFSVKKTDTLLAKQVLKITNGEITSDSVLRVPIRHDDSLFIEYHTSNIYLAERLLSHDAFFSIKDADTTVVAGLHSFERHTNEREDVIYGSMYRRWGHFGWNGNRTRATEPIDISQLKVSAAAKGQNSEIDTKGMTGEDLEGKEVYDAKQDRFFVLIASGSDQRWTSGDQHAYISADAVSSSRLGDDDLSILQVAMGGGGTGAPGIEKVSKSTGNAYTLGVSVGVTASYSHSDAKNKTLTDFMDMNGDRYPDIVSERVIQYTDARGGLSTRTTPSTGYVQETHATTDGIALTGSFPMTMPKFRSSNKNSNQSQTDAGDAATTSGSVSVSGSTTKGDNEANYVWMDMNADGLPDRVNMTTGKVALNLGYSFGNNEPWTFGQIQDSGSDTKSGGAGLGFNIGQNSISAGFSLARSDNFSNQVLMDVTGDGLPDKVEKGSPVKVWVNTGNTFEGPFVWTGANSVSENATASESANAAFTVGFALFGIKWTVTPSVSAGHGMSRELSKFSDINGDGNPDYLRSTEDNNIYVSLSTIGKTNMLRSVKRPMGASFDVAYHRVGNTYEMPSSMWVMDSLHVFDGHAGDGVDHLVTTFEYENGKHVRDDREFYGFEKVITKTRNTAEERAPVYTIVTQTYNNDNYYKKGLLLQEEMVDGDNNKFVITKNKYELKNIHTGADLTPNEAISNSGNAFPALTETIQEYYEGQSDAGKTTRVTNEYDAKGNIKRHIDYGDETPDDDITADISYYSLELLYLMNVPERITVTSNGSVLRKRESVIDQTTGDILKIKQYSSDEDISVFDMEYDQYGSLKKITHPENAAGQRLSFEYEYDGTVFTYPTKVTNSYGDISESTYDLRFGEVLTSKDLNGNVIKYELDKKGRVVKVTGPYEKNGGYTIEFRYAPNAEIPWALTRHYDPAFPTNALETVNFVDGLGRVLQTKKDGAIFDGDGKADKEVMIVSGRVKFDAFGRVISARYPITESIGAAGTFNPMEDNIPPTTNTYDVLNRPVKVILPDNSVTETVYGFGADKFGDIQFTTRTTDANGKITEKFTDSKGRVTSLKNHTSENPVWTAFKYNPVGEQVEAIDDLGHATSSVYDYLGRRTERRHPDAGTTRYAYDPAGNLKEVVTANLAADGLAISYKYDFERLTEILYPQNPENNVKYTYGEHGASDNRAGRVVLQEDASGAQEFFYGPLGEVVKNIRTIIIPQHDEQTYTTEWEYDTWNRLTSMTYADGEKVTYSYNTGGLLRSMTGKKKNANYAYVNQLGYDKFEQRTFLAYGNGTKTTYAYEPDRRRLKNLTAMTAGKRLFMDNVYGYDNVNNILSFKNNAPIPSPNLMGGSSEYTYTYDDLYRMTSAEGIYKGPNDDHTYSLAMTYNSVGGITQKDQTHLRKGQQQKKTSYQFSYVYGETQPHAPVHIGNQTYTYDANGNQTGWTSDVSGQSRRVLWDEENRIRSIYDNGSQHHYIYDASGERVIKGKSTGQRVFVNGEWKAGSGQMGNYTVYVNPFLVLRSGGYTKHYYIEGQRIVSKLGGGWDNNGKGPLKAGGNKVDYAGRGQRVFEGIVKNLKFLGADGQILTAGKSGKIPPGQINGTGGTGGSVTEAFRYFYHPDHLGSTAYVTDASGEVFQHLEYFAFGETFVEEHSNTDRTPYLFNGKEFDEETGMYYYGARYYDPRISIFPSVDPKGEELINMSPYAYAADNPVKFVDVDGQYPKPSEILKKAGFELNPFAAGFLDGLADASPIGAIGFAYDLATDSEFRQQTIDGIKSLMEDPVGSMKKMVGDKADTYAAVFAGNATEEQKYSVGEDLGNLTGAILTGGGIKKLFDKLTKKGVIYEVPGSFTKSGKPYIGRSDKWSVRKKYSADGRDRSHAKIVGRYNTNKPKAGAVAEQKAMNKKGGVKKLDNKRNEIKEGDWEKFKIKPAKEN